MVAQQQPETARGLARTFGSDLVATDSSDHWVYVAGPLAGAALAVGMAFVLRGAGGGRSGSEAAQEALYTQVIMFENRSFGNLLGRPYEPVKAYRLLGETVRL